MPHSPTYDEHLARIAIQHPKLTPEEQAAIAEHATSFHPQSTHQATLMAEGHRNPAEELTIKVANDQARAAADLQALITEGHAAAIESAIGVIAAFESAIEGLCGCVEESSEEVMNGLSGVASENATAIASLEAAVKTSGAEVIEVLAPVVPGLQIIHQGIQSAFTSQRILAESHNRVQERNAWVRTGVQTLVFLALLLLLCFTKGRLL